MLSFQKRIRFIVMDVDGTLTDGKINMGDSGEMMKAFDIKDGCGIKEILPKCSLVPVIITARNSEILKNRCNELGVLELHQGVRNKIGTLEKILNEFSERDGTSYSLQNVAYVGDDLLDIQCMKAIKEAGGLTACPCDAAREVVDIASFICTKKGGDGAIRELIDWITGIYPGRRSELERIRTICPVAYDFISKFNPSTNFDGRYDLGNGVFANVMSYITREACLTCYETHEKYIDVQYVIYGTEMMMTQPVEELDECISTPYNEAKDITLYNNNSGKVSILNPGDSIILYTNDAHRGAILVCRPTPVRKIVVKVPIGNVKGKGKM